MQTHKFKQNKKWPLVLWTGLGLLLLLVPLTWLALNNWNVEESLVKSGLVKKEVDATPEEPLVPEEENTPTLPDTKDNEEEQVEEPVTPPSESPVPNEKEEGNPEEKDKEETPVEQVETPSKEETPSKDETSSELPKTPTIIQGILVANKNYPLPSTYAPGENKEAREAFNKLAAAARLDGFELVAFSTYRSYDYQKTLYEKYVARDGQEAADRYSARPGYSEHQSGLAFDIGEKNFEQHWASPTFGDTPAGKWVAANAHNYGFILRYPIGKEKVTGYMHESWHYRFIGVGPAQDIFKNNITLEEYLGL